MTFQDTVLNVTFYLVPSTCYIYVVVFPVLEGGTFMINRLIGWFLKSLVGEAHTGHTQIIFGFNHPNLTIYYFKAKICIPL